MGKWQILRYGIFWKVYIKQTEQQFTFANWAIPEWEKIQTGGRVGSSDDIHFC